ncbi:MULTISPECIES: acyltransferase family protein [Fischerella]|uniref:Acyltransferase n=1 Tax=Fischerella muscicola CCMEE 5323 TaxID=2019572 RepID=A0A2N6K705_FISMU|nr:MULTISPECIES: acyltransferase [Fischerella]MBD2429923.1 acyltransferase [Fischerella sp. FACHB-380]PLZ92938.1 acyltransferase [Fischerella muscicola CCMEE 5323]
MTEIIKNKKLHLHYLDGLRGLAALYVLFVHIEPSMGEELPFCLNIFQLMMRYGRISVVVFIVLSGYGLMLSVVRSQSNYISGGFIGYIKRRAWRILPAYYATLILCIILAIGIRLVENFTSFQWAYIPVFQPFSPYFSFSDLVYHLLLINNINSDISGSINPPLWTVATEWQLYFFFPLLLLPIWRRFGLLTVVISACLIGLIPLYLLNGLFESASPWFLGVFAIGMTAAEIGFSQKPKLITFRNLLPWDQLAIVFTVVAFLTEWRRLGLHIWISEYLFGMATACLFIYCTQLVIDGKKLPRILQVFEHPLAIALGTFSYSLYLTHGPVLALVSRFLLSLHIPPTKYAVALYVLGVAASLIFAYLFYLVFERPFMSSFLKRRKVKDVVI